MWKYCVKKKHCHFSGRKHEVDGKASYNLEIKLNSKVKSLALLKKFICTNTKYY